MSGAGKGDSARNCHTEAYRAGWERVFGRKVEPCEKCKGSGLVLETCAVSGVTTPVRCECQPKLPSITLDFLK